MPNRLLQQWISGRLALNTREDRRIASCGPRAPGTGMRPSRHAVPGQARAPALPRRPVPTLLLDEPDSVPGVGAHSTGVSGDDTGSVGLGPAASGVERARCAAGAGVTTAGPGVGERAGAGAGLYRCARAPVPLGAGVNGGHAGRLVRQPSQLGAGPDASCRAGVRKSAPRRQPQRTRRARTSLAGLAAAFRQVTSGRAGPRTASLNPLPQRENYPPISSLMSQYAPCQGRTCGLFSDLGRGCAGGRLGNRLSIVTLSRAAARPRS